MTVSVLLLLLCATTLCSAHLEDYCVGNASAGGVTNFYAAADKRDCKYGSYRPDCLVDVLKVSAKTFQNVSSCRGAVHFDAVYIVASALGFLPEYSYWLAAFSQAVDFVQFKGLDSCGLPQPAPLWTPPLRGLMRVSAPTGGSARHLGMPYGQVKTNGLQLNLTDPAEGMLTSYRGWARGETDILCTNGLTEPGGNSLPFGGSRCATGWMPPTPSKMTQGPIPANYTPYQLGEQVIDYECGDPSCSKISNPVYASEFERHLNSSGFARMSDGAPVPATIARMGTYMHMLADRASHYWCTDSKKSGILEKKGQQGNFTSALDQLKCNFVTHAMEHYWEQGVSKPLAPQSWAALRMYYDELSSFKELPAAAAFFNSSFTPIPKTTLLGSKKQPGTLPTAIMKRDVMDRMGGMYRLIAESGLTPLPGFERRCGGAPW